MIRSMIMAIAASTACWSGLPMIWFWYCSSLATALVMLISFSFWSAGRLPSRGLKLFYYRGLKERGHVNGYLTDTCLAAQDFYKKILDYFKIRY